MRTRRSDGASWARSSRTRTCRAATIWITIVTWSASLAPAADSPRELQLVTIVSWFEADGQQRLGDEFSLRAARKKPEEGTPVFLALSTEEWWPGMVPLFAIEKEGGTALRRVPLKGQENLVEPLFFGAPPAGDVNALRLAGTWRCTATRGGAEDAWFAWQLITEGDSVIGRFDPHSDYRVAYLKGGHARSNQIELAVEYSNTSYLLKGEWRDGKLVGTWTGTEPGEQGRWEAVRPAQALDVPAATLVPLYEWRQTGAAGTARRYSTIPPGPDWTRAEQPLCRVWPLRAGATNEVPLIPTPPGKRSQP